MKPGECQSTGRPKMAPPLPRSSVRFKGPAKTLLDEIRALPEEKCRLHDGTMLKAQFVRFVEDRWDEDAGKPRRMFRWTTWNEAWVDFLVETRHGLPRAA